MWKKIAAAGGAAAAILGAGGIALAASGNNYNTPSSNPSTSASASTSPGQSTASGPVRPHPLNGRRLTRPGLARLRNLEHGSWVTGSKTGTNLVTHDIIRGAVSSVSGTSITVESGDKVTQTYTVNADTKVHTRAVRSGAAITAVHPGDEVIVTGTGTTTLTAVQVVDLAKS